MSIGSQEHGRAAALVRPAVTEDVPRIEEVVQAAYRPWVERLGVRPQPLSADYAEPGLYAPGRPSRQYPMNATCRLSTPRSRTRCRRRPVITDDSPANQA